MAVSERVII